MNKQPPGHHSGIPALVPGGVMCTAGMAMLGSAFLQPTGYMLHISKCSIVIDFCTKSCQAGLFSISAMSVRKFPFLGQIPYMFHSSPRDSIPSDWAWSPIIPITTHLLTCVPSLAHPPIRLPTPATPDSEHFFLFWTNLQNSNMCLSITYGQHPI